MTRTALVGSDPAFRAAVTLARRVAKGRSTIILCGPTGSGKSHLARCLHTWGDPPTAPFLEWYAGGVPETLLEAELLGVHHGAATDVGERPGVFEAAGNGTLCLLGLELLATHQQAALLRLLEGEAFQRIGGGGAVKSKARIVAVFQDPPETLVQRGLLRTDLLYRLDVFRLELPPLALRPSDIGPLARHFLKVACSAHKRKVPALSPGLLLALQGHPWPGNLRELSQRMEALALSGADPLDKNDLPPSFWAGPSPLEEAAQRRLTLAEMKDAYIREVLARVGGNRSQAANWLGISRKALWAHLKRESD